MGTKLGSELVAQARHLLQDESNIVARWTDAQLLNALNEAQLAVVTFKPDSLTARTSHNLTAGTLQTLPADALALIGVPRNMGVGGATPGRAVTRTTVDSLNHADPYWHAAAQQVDVYQFAFDDSENSHFHVWPPSDGTGSVELVYSQYPAELGALTDAITLGDQYAPAMIRYIAFMELSTDSDTVANRALAESLYAQFTQLVMGKTQSELAVSPNPAGE